MPARTVARSIGPGSGHHLVKAAGLWPGRALAAPDASISLKRPVMSSALP